MKRSVTKTKIYSVEWDERLYFISLHFKEEGIIAVKYRPPSLIALSINSDYTEEEFLNIWTRFIIGLSVCAEEKDTIDRNIGALTFTVMDAIMIRRNISFTDLLKHIDFFSVMLRDEGISDDKIRTLYIPVTKAMLSNFKDNVIDSATGMKFTDTPIYHHFDRFFEELNDKA